MVLRSTSGQSVNKFPLKKVKMRAFILSWLLLSVTLAVECKSNESNSTEDQARPSLESDESDEKDQVKEPSHCEKVVPLQAGHITKFVGSRFYKGYNTTMELYMRQGKKSGEIEAIFKNVSEVCNPKVNCRKDCNCVHEIDVNYVENNILYIRCLENSWFNLKKNTFFYVRKGKADLCWRSILIVLDNWVGLSYNNEVLDNLKNKDLVQPKIISMDPAGKCQEIYSKLSESEDNIKISSYTNDTLCGGRRAGHRFEHNVTVVLNKNDLTMISFESDMKSLDDGHFFLEQMEFDKFLPISESDSLFKDHQEPQFEDMEDYE